MMLLVPFGLALHGFFDRFAVGPRILDDEDQFADFVIQYVIEFLHQIVAQAFANADQRGHHGQQHHQGVPERQPRTQRSKKSVKSPPGHIRVPEWS